MPRIQVYLPDDLHREVKRSGLSPSELLQDAVRSELQRRQQITWLDEYLGELEKEVGKPTRAEKARADAVVRRMTRRRTARRAS
jgi:Arc/MetJ-type ribon-helix-helix transcriptional regulator